MLFLNCGQFMWLVYPSNIQLRFRIIRQKIHFCLIRRRLKSEAKAG